MWYNLGDNQLFLVIRNIRYQAYVLSNELHSVVFCKKYNGAIKINHHVLEKSESWAFIWILAKKGFIFYYSKTNFKKENDVIYFVVSNVYALYLSSWQIYATSQLILAKYFIYNDWPSEVQFYVYHVDNLDSIIIIAR